MSATGPTTPGESLTLEWALDYAANYWKRGNEPESQAALTILWQTVTTPTAAAKDEALVELAARVERLRITNPMNGDGSNYMLDKVLAFFPDTVKPAIEAERAARREREDEQVRYFAELNRRAPEDR